MSNPWKKKNELFGRIWSPDPCWSNPLRNDQVDVIVEVAKSSEAKRILDLGCGPGAIARRLLVEIPKSEVVGIDCSAHCLRRAQDVLEAFTSRFRLIHADLESAWQDQTEFTPGFDLILAVQSLHHLRIDMKRKIIQTSVSMLAPTGLFVVSDKYEVAPEFVKHCMSIEELACKSRRIDVQAERLSQGHCEGDVPSSISQDIQLFREAGLSATCIWRFGRRAIILGTRG